MDKVEEHNVRVVVPLLWIPAFKWHTWLSGGFQIITPDSFWESYKPFVICTCRGGIETTVDKIDISFSSSCVRHFRPGPVTTIVEEIKPLRFLSKGETL